MDDSRSSATAVPHARTPLIGRDDVVASILGLLATDGVRIVTVAGLSGVGKTTVADEVARQVVRSEPIGVERLRCNDGPEDLAAEIDAVLGASSTLGIDVDSQPPPGRTRLVLLDGFEHHLDQVGRLGRALDEDADLTVLVTSVSPLGLRGEHVVRLHPLGLPPRTDRLDLIADAPAVQLLVERIRALDPSFVLDEPAAVDAAALCRQLDGLPLALELVAAPCAETSIAAVLRQLDARSPLDLLDRGAVDAAARHRTLRETIAWSVDLLAPDEAVAFRRLGTFHGPVALDDAAAVIADASLDAGRAWTALRGVVGHGLSVRDPDGAAGRIGMLASVRELAREQLVEHGELDELRARHARHFAEVATRRATRLWTAEHAATRREIASDADELAVAADVLAAQGEVVAAIRLVVGAHTGWIDRGRAASGGELLDRLLDGTSTVDEMDRLAGRTAAAELAFWTRANRDRHQDLLVQLDSSIDGAVEAGRPDLALISSATVVQLAIGVDDLGLAERVATRARRIAQDVGDRWWATRFTSWSAAVANQQGRVDDAVRLARDALQGAQRNGDDWQLLRTVFVVAGLPDEVRPTLSVPDEDEAIALAVQLGDVQAEGVLRIRAALSALARADLPTAARQIGSALELGRHHGHWYVEEICVAALTLTCIAGGRSETAARLHGGLEPVMGDLQRRLSPTHLGWYVGALDAVRVALGDERFQAATLAGARLGWRELLRTCDAVVLDLQAPEADRAASPGAGDTATTNQDADSALTGRELEVLAQLAEGRSNKEIAVLLGIRPKTVMHHTSNIYRKLAVAGRAEAVSVAWRNGLLRAADAPSTSADGVGAAATP